MSNEENQHSYVDGEDVLMFMNMFKDSVVPPLTEDIMLKGTLKHQKEDSFYLFKDWILHLLDPELDVYEQWKDFFLRHGYINEKEEIIYKPQPNKDI